MLNDGIFREAVPFDLNGMTTVAVIVRALHHLTETDDAPFPETGTAEDDAISRHNPQSIATAPRRDLGMILFPSGDTVRKSWVLFGVPEK